MVPQFLFSLRDLLLQATTSRRAMEGAAPRIRTTSRFGHQRARPATGFLAVFSALRPGERLVTSGWGGFRVEGCLFCATWEAQCGPGTFLYFGWDVLIIGSNYLKNPQSRQNNSPKALNIVQKAIILHTLGVQVVASIRMTATLFNLSYWNA